MIEILVADITTLASDAIVNAATRGLAGGGRVDGAMHAKAGPRLVARRFDGESAEYYRRRQRGDGTWPSLAGVDAASETCTSREVGHMRVRLNVLGAAALLASLTGATGFRDAITAPETCALITRQEAASALGAAVPAGVEKVMDLPLEGRTIKAYYCFYGSEVNVARYSLGSRAQALFGQYRQSLASESGYQNVPGVGDEAFAAKGQQAVRAGQTGLIIDVGQARGGGARELRAEKGLAALVVGRLR